MTRLLLSVCLKFPCCGADKGGRAEDKRCVVAAVEIWTTILIVIAWRPTFPVGTIMAIACNVCAQRERSLVRVVDKRQPHADCCGSPYLAASRWEVNLQEPQWRQPYMNKQCWLCENIIGSLVSGQLLHTARCSLSYLPGDIFCWRWLTQKEKPLARNCEAARLWPADVPYFSACFELESILFNSPIHPTAARAPMSHTITILGSGLWILYA